MIEERRVRERLTVVEEWVDKHEQRHYEFEAALRHNTELTKAIESNTSELVTLFKGASNVRTFFVWASPIVAALASILAFIAWLFGRHL